MRKIHVALALVAALAMASTAAVAQNLGTFISPNGQVKTFVTHATPMPSGILPSGPPIGSSSGNVANASAVATLAGAVGKTTYITDFQCTASGSTAALVVNATVTGVTGGTMTYTFVFPAGATAQATPLIVPFPTPLQATATNVAIVVTLPAGGAGNTNAACTAHGFQVS